VTNIPIYIGPHEVYTSAKLVLQTHLPAALAAYGTAHGYTFKVPKTYWLYEDIEREWQSPGIGFSISASSVIAVEGMGSKDLAHTLQVLGIMRLPDMVNPAQTTVKKDLNYYRQGIRDYMDAVGKTLETYMPSPVYQATSYVYRVDIGQAIGQVYEDQSDGSDFTLALAIELIAYQRVRARTPYTVPVPP
jgi:hypothetical protein